MNSKHLLFRFLILVVIFLPCAQPVAAQQMKEFPLTAVRIDSGIFFNAQSRDLQYILALNPDRLLAPFLREAGLPRKDSSYGNWEGSGLDGHIGGHYLSALALMYASTGEDELRRRLDYMVDVLDRCQQKNGNGYVGAIPGGHAVWEEVRKGDIRADNFSLNGKWVPLYNIHKLFAGLYDAHVVGGNARAREVFFKLCDWFAGMIAPLPDAKIQQLLRSEHGGMNEIFAAAAQLSGDAKYMELARRLTHRKVLNPLLSSQDSLTGMHANTQIPKVIGVQRIARATNDDKWNQAAKFFWTNVVDKRSVSIGGNSVREHFHPADDFGPMIESNQGPETCNTYNMLKLTTGLFMSSPDAGYMDYYERALYNHILSSQHPDHGGLVYFTPMRPRHYRVYSHPQKSFWCCVGSGIENHAKYGEMIYSEKGDELWLNLFIPSTVEWKKKGVALRQETRFPFEDESRVIVTTASAVRFTLQVRHPEWVKDGQFVVRVNGKQVRVSSRPSSYAAIDRTWNNGDVVSIRVPMYTRVEMLPDGSSWGSFVHGPIVLAADAGTSDIIGLVADDSRMGHVAEGKFYPIDETPVIVKKDEKFVSQIRPVKKKPFTFSPASLVYPAAASGLELVPFFTLHDRRYTIYFPIATPSELKQMQADLRKKEEVVRALKARTVDEVICGEQQPEVEHRFSGDSTESGFSNGRSWRSSNGWFAYELSNTDHRGAILRVTYSTGGFRRRFRILVNDEVIKEESLPDKWDDNATMIEYNLPASQTNATGLQIRFDALPGHNTGRIHSVQLLSR